MAQTKKMAAAQTERPRDEDGRFTDKAEAAKPSVVAGNGAKSKDGKAKSASGSGASKEAPAKAKSGGSGKAQSKSR